jgi:hypothetical protein
MGPPKLKVKQEKTVETPLALYGVTLTLEMMPV